MTVHLVLEAIEIQKCLTFNREFRFKVFSACVPVLRVHHSKKPNYFEFIRVVDGTKEGRQIYLF